MDDLYCTGREPPEQDSLIFADVTFDHPVIEEIKAAGLTAVDMHYHTNHSDGMTQVKDALKLARKRRVGLSITDHNEISGVIEAVRAGSEALLIPGIEVSALDGPHVLLFFSQVSDLKEFYSRHIEPNKGISPYLATRLPTDEIVRRAGDHNAVRVAAHPCGYLLFNRGVQRCIDRDCLNPEVMDYFEGLEVICGSMTREHNGQAAELARRYRLGITGGTDGHLLGDLGRVVTCAEADGVEEFLEAIIRRKTVVIGAEKSLLAKGMMGSLVLTRYIKYAIPSLQVHYEQNIPRIGRFLKKTRDRFR
jgi:predicted metal-dependent phosphoesterase TrpH